MTEKNNKASAKYITKTVYRILGILSLSTMTTLWLQGMGGNPNEEKTNYLKE